MKRAATVVLIAVLTAMLSGIKDATWARQTPDTQAGDAHQKEIATRLAGIPVGSAIELELVGGAKFQALLDIVAPDSITVRMASGDFAFTRVIPLDEIKTVKRIRRIGRSMTRRILFGLGIGGAVVVGACAAALAFLDATDPSTPGPKAKTRPTSGSERTKSENRGEPPDSRD
jgi:hypothetical protein